VCVAEHIRDIFKPFQLDVSCLVDPLPYVFGGFSVWDACQLLMLERWYINVQVNSVQQRARYSCTVIGNLGVCTGAGIGVIT
jgi:hypothetical protein